MEDYQGLPSTATRGRLRMARLGTEICFLFADADGPYQIVNQRPCSKDVSSRYGIALECLANGTSTSSVVWKTLTLRAGKIE